MKKTFFYLWFLVFGFFSSERQCFAKQFLTVRKVEGTVFVRAATSVDWITVKKGSQLKFGQIIMVTKNSVVTLEGYSKKSKGIQSEKTQLTITQPLVARLTHNFLRQVKIDAFFLHPTHERTTDALSTDTGASILTLKEAWERLSTLLSKVQPSDPVLPELGELERIGMKVAHSAKKLDILSPEVNAFYQNSELPTELKVVWRAPEDQQLKYNVYLWPVGSRRGSAVAQTRYDFHTIKVSKSGVYFVQVTSTDGIWQSPPHAVHMSLRIENEIVGKTDGKNENLAGVEPDFPPDQYVADLPDSKYFQFSWHSESSLDKSKKQAYRFTLKNADNAVVFERRTDLKTLSVPIKAGEYFWSIQGNLRDVNNSPRKLTIIEANSLQKKAVRSRLIQQAVSSGHDVTISLGQGL